MGSRSNYKLGGQGRLYWGGNMRAKSWRVKQPLEIQGRSFPVIKASSRPWVGIWSSTHECIKINVVNTVDGYMLNKITLQPTLYVCFLTSLPKHHVVILFCVVPTCASSYLVVGLCIYCVVKKLNILFCDLCIHIFVKLCIRLLIFLLLVWRSSLYITEIGPSSLRCVINKF